MSVALEDLARALWDACPTVKPAWDQLGGVTQSVWLERAAAGETPEKPYKIASTKQVVTQQAPVEACVEGRVQEQAASASATPPATREEAARLLDGKQATEMEESQGSLF